MNNPKNAPRTASQSAPNQIIQQAQAKAQQNPGDIDKLKAVSAPRSNYPHQIYQRARAVWLAVTGQYSGLLSQGNTQAVTKLQSESSLMLQLLKTGLSYTP